MTPQAFPAVHLHVGGDRDDALSGGVVAWNLTWKVRMSRSSCRPRRPKSNVSRTLSAKCFWFDTNPKSVRIDSVGVCCTDIAASGVLRIYLLPLTRVHAWTCRSFRILQRQQPSLIFHRCLTIKDELRVGIRRAFEELPFPIGTSDRGPTPQTRAAAKSKRGGLGT